MRTLGRCACAWRSAIRGVCSRCAKFAAELSPGVSGSDVRMAGMDGIEATRRIKANQPEAAVLVLTVLEEADYLLEAVRAGASGYLLKDCSRQQLLTAIRTLRAGGS